MAEAQQERKLETQASVSQTNIKETATTRNQSSSSENDQNKNTNAPFKFNAQAREFVPRTQQQTSSSTTTTTNSTNAMPISGFLYPCFHYIGGTSGASNDIDPNWFLVGNNIDHHLFSNPTLALPGTCLNKNNVHVLTDDIRQKIVKQVEYQFSDMSLLANETMSKHISKDPEGYVPISFIASSKKMKSLISNNHLLSKALQSSPNLVVSEDGKKVKRKTPFTEKDREDLQSRTVVVENLPDDHSHQNLEKIFSVIGSVKTIRICHPPESNSSRPRSDFILSNKLHALIEFESPDIAEKAVEKLNDERNWRKGLRVRLLLRCSPKSVLKNRKDFDDILDEDDAHHESNEDSPQSGDSNADENSGASKKGSAKGRSAKSKGRGGKGILAAPTAPSATINTPSETSHSKHAVTTSKGPRMPDGTRGFGIGRGKLLSATTPATAALVVEQ